MGLRKENRGRLRKLMFSFFFAGISNQRHPSGGSAKDKGSIDHQMSGTLIPKPPGGAPRASMPFAPLRWIWVLALAGRIVATTMLLSVFSPWFLILPALPCCWFGAAVLLRVRKKHLRRARLEGELHVLQALRTVSGAVDGVEPAQIAETFLSACCRATSASQALLLILDDATDTALVMGDHPPGSTESATGKRYPMGSGTHGSVAAGPIGMAARTMEPVVSSDVNASIEFVHWLDVSAGGLQVTIPIITGGQAIGCVLLWFRQSGEVPESCDVAQVIVQAATPILARLQAQAAETEQVATATPDMQLSMMDLIQ